MEQVNVNDFISKIVNANIKRVIEQVNQLQIEVKALKERMDHTEKNVVNNMESAVFMNKITAEIRKRLQNGAD